MQAGNGKARAYSAGHSLPANSCATANLDLQTLNPKTLNPKTLNPNSPNLKP